MKLDRIILKSKSGEIAIMQLVSGDIEDAVKKFQASHPEYIEYYISATKLPESRQFRDAWTLKNNKVVIDEVKASSIHLGRVRLVRNQELEKLDRAQLQCLADPDKVQELDEKKQVLRDLPDKITTLEWPKELPPL